MLRADDEPRPAGDGVDTRWNHGLAAERGDAIPAGNAETSGAGDSVRPSMAAESCGAGESARADNDDSEPPVAE